MSTNELSNTSTAPSEWKLIPAGYDDETGEWIPAREMRTRPNIPMNLDGRVGFGFTFETRWAA